jgi:hypothetical protein
MQGFVRPNTHGGIISGSTLDYVVVSNGLNPKNPRRRGEVTKVEVYDEHFADWSAEGPLVRPRAGDCHNRGVLAHERSALDSPALSAFAAHHQSSACTTQVLPCCWD